MKILDLIAELQKAAAHYGNIDVTAAVSDNDSFNIVDVAGLSFDEASIVMTAVKI